MSATRKGPPERDAVTDLAATLRPLMKSLKEIKAKAEALGIFTGDRELLACEACGLMEDVLADGRLITDREERLGQDTGLRFVETGEGTGMYTCPACGNEVHLEEECP